jgi:lysozyme-like protein
MIPVLWPVLGILLLVLYEQSRARSRASQPPPPLSLTGGTTYSLADLRALAVQYGFADPDTAAAVAMAESGGNPCAQGDPRGSFDCSGPNGYSTSFGLWQIHVPAHREYDPTSLLDPNYNAQAALAISNGGTYWHPWSTYTTSNPLISYRRYMPGGWGGAPAGGGGSGAPAAAGGPPWWTFGVAALGLGAMAWLSGAPARVERARRVAESARATTPATAPATETVAVDSSSLDT